MGLMALFARFPCAYSSPSLCFVFRRGLVVLIRLDFLRRSHFPSSTASSGVRVPRPLSVAFGFCLDPLFLLQNSLQLLIPAFSSDFCPLVLRYGVRYGGGLLWM
ncbi:hypothetical protein A2U01_0018750, partial [Trifolium medium]|nr:hypothetical protein [Trifolium medium]